MPDISMAKVQITLTIAEFRELVAMVNLATDTLDGFGEEVPEIAGEVSGLYFELMENLQGGYLGDFEPE